MMRYESIHQLEIPKIGFGTWTIGGRDGPDYPEDVQSLAAMRSALEIGYTHFDTAEYYAGGHAEELLGEAVRQSGIARDTLFITSKVSPEHLQYADVLRCCENSLRRLRMESLDLYLIHWPMRGMNLADTFRALNELVRSGKVRYLGVSNFNLKLLQQSCSLSETPLLTNQVSFSIPDREYQNNGVLEYCQQNNILLTAYSPVKRRNITSNKMLKAIAHAHGVTSQQVALAWLAMQTRVITIPMSRNPQHQLENYQAGELLLSPVEMEQLA
jgi:diketogulonate reductase-like aldo/keto reductase